MIKKAIYAGSFDPITKGHLDIITRAKNLTDELVIGVLYNINKKDYWFTVDERIEMIKNSIIEMGHSLDNIKVISFNGLLVELIEQEKIDVLIRGLRAISDYEYEVQINLINDMLSKKSFETIFLNASRQYLYLSSSVVKEVAVNNGELSYFVTNNVAKMLREKVEKING
ncbi:pantetheine-phosphate adenylyltransferase [Caviibacter abscessus]|uniref:pantetheine-phosphate adenylyltransferase n=1 Tax=Caviibacter abscessus TaxID=1766719 RepID=UPI00082BC46E|nr:pantetheine-phosphate adenylyltransferase [Caviibacter abscessus]